MSDNSPVSHSNQYGSADPAVEFLAVSMRGTHCVKIVISFKAATSQFRGINDHEQFSDQLVDGVCSELFH